MGGASLHDYNHVSPPTADDGLSFNFLASPKYTCIISSGPFSVFTSMRTLRQKGKAPGTFISCPHSKARLDGHPRSLAAAAGNSASRSGVVVKRIAAISLVSSSLALTILESSLLVAARMLFLLFAETAIAPRMPRHCNLTPLL